MFQLSNIYCSNYCALTISGKLPLYGVNKLELVCGNLQLHRYNLNKNKLKKLYKKLRLYKVKKRLSFMNSFNGYFLL